MVVVRRGDKVMLSRRVSRVPVPSVLLSATDSCSLRCTHLELYISLLSCTAFDLKATDTDVIVVLQVEHTSGGAIVDVCACTPEQRGSSLPSLM